MSTRPGNLDVVSSLNTTRTEDQKVITTTEGLSSIIGLMALVKHKSLFLSSLS